MLKINLHTLPTGTPSGQVTGLSPRVELPEFQKLRATQIQKRLYWECVRYSVAHSGFTLYFKPSSGPRYARTRALQPPGSSGCVLHAALAPACWTAGPRHRELSQTDVQRAFSHVNSEALRISRGPQGTAEQVGRLAPLSSRAGGILHGQPVKVVLLQIRNKMNKCLLKI